jgi:VanZ family protein
MGLGLMNAWAWVSLAWVGVIFFSSSSVAGKSSEEAFSALSQLLLRQFPPGTRSYDIVHLLADKSVHIGLFAIFAVLLWGAFANASGKIPWILLIGAFIGTCSELLQNLFPSRDPAVRDVLINIGGTTLGVIVRVVISKVYPPGGNLTEMRASRQGAAP